MMTYIDIALVAVIVIYIVDLSGFTTSWRELVARWLRIPERRLRPLPPFDCGQCAVWWTCLLWALCSGNFTLPVVAWCAALSFLSAPLGQLAVLLREALAKAIRDLLNIVER